MAVWRTSDSSQQNFATYNADGGEPVRCYIKVKTDAVGSAGLVKTSEDGKVEGIQFQITGSDGSTTTKTTDANGNIDIEGLPIYAADGSKITYTATEINVPNKYVKPQSQTFQLTEGQTASIQFENKLKRWRVTVTKSDDRTGGTPQGNGFEVLEDGSVKEYREGEAAYNQVKRGDLKFVKVGEDTMHRFANVAFKLTSQTTGESHILITDSNGEVRTETKWIPHTQNTNGNDEKPEAEWNDETGTWFGKTTEDWMVETQDGLCALPYDYYTLEELRCEGNKGYALVTVPNIFISRDSTVIELGTIDDIKEGTPEIGTTATADGEKYSEPLSEVTIVDTVRYSGLTVDKTYKLSGVLMDKATGEPLTVADKQVTAEKEFTPKAESGTEELSYTFNASALVGKSVVVFEDLFEGESKVASHADIEDEGQTVEFTEPKIGTTATANGEHSAEPVGEITIIDTVKYSGLIPGKEYTVKGVLMDKATGKPLMVNDKEITAEATFRASKAEGTIDIPFTFDASALAGKTVVAFETLYRDKLEVCAHADIEDEDQTVTFSEKPEIKTTATVNGEKKAEPKGEVTIKDTVSYTGLTPGKTYKLSGVLMDKNTGGKLLVDGKEITSEKEFTPENANGTEEITFTFDASDLAGKSVVVFETLTHDGEEVAVHADITDEGQTVEFEKADEPQIKTTATANGEKKAEPVGEVTIKDTVSYTGLTPGNKLSGVLMDKSSGAALLVDGQKVTAEKEFTPENASGSVEITFTFDASALAGKSVVVFETLYHEGKEVAVHADITDEGQTVEFENPDGPSIKTEATVDGEKEVDPLDEITVTDKVSYFNLTPGKPYKISGILMDKATGEKLLVDGKEVTAQVEFTPENATGTVEIPFTFNASTLAGKSIVVFETLYQDDVEVFVHADINDKSQTIAVCGLGGLIIKKTAEDNFVEGISFLITGKDYSKKFKTDKNGEIRVEGLAPGEYTVTEITDKVTARYEIQEGQTVTVTAGDLAEVKFHNKLLRGQIVGRKTDTEGNPLEGVLFGLFPKDAKEFTKDKAIATAKTDKAGKFEFKDVPYGDWQIVELEPLPGYVPLSDSIKATVDSSTVTLEDIQNTKAKIVISKVDSVTGKELAGAKLEIRDKDGKVVESWTTDGKPHTMDRLPAGEYVLHEVSAPEGYLVAKDVKFTVKDTDEAITVVMKDRPKDHPGTPNTGDTGWRLALAVFGVSLGGVVVSLVLSRKKKEEQD